MAAGLGLGRHFQEHALAGAAEAGVRGRGAVEHQAVTGGVGQHQLRHLAGGAGHGQLTFQALADFGVQRGQRRIRAGHQGGGERAQGGGIAGLGEAAAHAVAGVGYRHAAVDEVQLYGLVGIDEQGLDLLALGVGGLGQAPVVGRQQGGGVGQGRRCGRVGGHAGGGRVGGWFGRLVAGGQRQRHQQGQREQQGAMVHESLREDAGHGGRRQVDRWIW